MEIDTKLTFLIILTINLVFFCVAIQRTLKMLLGFSKDHRNLQTYVTFFKRNGLCLVHLKLKLIIYLSLYSCRVFLVFEGIWYKTCGRQRYGKSCLRNRVALLNRESSNTYEGNAQLADVYKYLV